MRVSVGGLDSPGAALSAGADVRGEGELTVGVLGASLSRLLAALC